MEVTPSRTPTVISHAYQPLGSLSAVSHRWPALTRRHPRQAASVDHAATPPSTTVNTPTMPAVERQRDTQPTAISA